MQQQTNERHDDLQKLDDPEFFRHWAELRRRTVLSGKSVPDGLRSKYTAARDEYRRRVARAS